MLDSTVVRNCLSIDVEAFAEANVESFRVAAHYLDAARQAYEIERNVDYILALLHQLQIKATFFFLGRIADESPQIVRAVAKGGHEIACHSYHHRRIFGMRPGEFREKLCRAKGSLESVGAEKVYGFRAPDFSITRDSLWALDVLAELGFCYDSSIYPIGGHDVYGITTANRFIHRLPSGLVEWPLPTVDLLGIRVPVGGGGYFRLFSLGFTRSAIASLNRQQQPCMLYIHPYEVGPVIPKVSGMSLYRRFRHYHHCKDGAERLQPLLDSFRFGRAIDILEHLDLVNRSENKSHVA